MEANFLQHDIVVVGGGMVGAAAALGLAQQGLSVAMIEAFAPKPYDDSQPIDIRVSAISVASEQLLESVGALDSLLAKRCVAYQGLETWELEGFITQFHAKQINASHLGHIVENRLVQLALWEQIECTENITLYCPETIHKIQRFDKGIVLELGQGLQLQTKLLVGADGANSQVRQWAGIGLTGWDYAQSAMLINIETEDEQQDVTWQQFTPKGPRSLLPLPGRHASLVWYDDAARIAQLQGLSHKALAEQVRANFPSRLNPKFKVLAKGSFPLTRRHALRYCENNVVILGDAAHTINPLAGQGVNLGFKDVAALVDTIKQAIEQEEAWWQESILKRYQTKRYRDNQLMMSTMDLFYASFSNDLLPLKLLRNGALKLANVDSPLKQQVLKYAMGLK
ncbi:FAD-dependent oxidoreductase [Shewanella gelidii]|uniref:2-octaprenyl-3-methyl-6-methoxy-1,4-benzoquinol hydroxylase n=1 Tax=Shewanella gelidii TaxID=1642821 RepID=A0A917N6Y6_9GAMM|nr:FAD-dependent oxidoreductase [Shewanella gelidii]MCL1097070.1 FAD-dependent oxidoreductase [Shewanella gelidii]GGI72360.1 2-octaprenyl-3-methyl-6-methoxy-1,4-benzoquinol hydroxylase [Shewanella gelidii]